MASLSRSYVFTLNNPEGLLDFTSEEDVRYAVYQEEIGDNGTHHYQGYIELSRPARLRRMQRLIPGAHFEKRRGTREQARDYAMKEDTRVGGPYEHGDWRAGGKGARSDLLAVQAALKAQKPMKDVADQFFSSWVKYHTALDKYAAMLKEDAERQPPEVILCYGPPGTGKTRYVVDESPNVYFKDNFSQWWDNYRGEDVVLDDYNGQLPFHYLLRVLDRYRCPIQIKGGTMWLTAKRIYLTSNRDPGDWYSDHEKRGYDLYALFRRITRWYTFTELGVPPKEAPDYSGFLANKP